MQICTLFDLFRFTVSQRSRDDAFRIRNDGRWSDVSSTAFERDVTAAGRGLVTLGLEPGDRVAILSANRYEWAVADLAILTRGAITVPIYATLPPAHVRTILERSGARLVFVSDAEQVAKLFEAGSVLGDLSAIVTFERVEAASPQLIAFADLRARGADAPDDLEATGGSIEPDDVATIIYTSGTTGEPKGVMLSHANLIANVADALASFPIGVSDSTLSFLPLSHVFERTAGLYVMFHAGASIAYAESLETVPRDALETRPTILLGVPRFFEKFQTRVLAAVRDAPAPRRKLFEWALDVGTRAVRAELNGDPIPAMLRGQRAAASSLVFSKLRNRIGGRLRFFVSGSAPLRTDVNLFFHAIGMPIYEGYGLTEASPVIAANTPAASRIGSVGRPFPRVRVRIGEENEIQAQGPNVTRGYFRDPDATREVFTSDGWLKTGDVGRVDAEGFLHVTDRLKDLIVTAGGKNVAPQPIEHRLRARPYIADGMLIGEGRRFIAAVILPDFDALSRFCESAHVDASDRRGILADSRVRELFRQEVDAANEGLARYEAIKDFILVHDELSVADGSLTPTMKIKRHVVLERYAPEIDALYRDGSP